MPKINLPNYNEFYEARYFTSGENLDGTVHIDRDVYRARYESDTESDDVEFEIEMAEFDGFEELEELEEDEEPDYIDEMMRKRMKNCMRKISGFSEYDLYL